MRIQSFPHRLLLLYPNSRRLHVFCYWLPSRYSLLWYLRKGSSRNTRVTFFLLLFSSLSTDLNLQFIKYHHWKVTQEWAEMSSLCPWTQADQHKSFPKNPRIFSLFKSVIVKLTFTAADVHSIDHSIFPWASFALLLWWAELEIPYSC